MTRRIVLTTTLLAFLGGGVAAYADGPTTGITHQVCVVTSDDPQHQTNDYLCVTPTHP